MDTLAALLLGLVQGLTEFLPVSSSGHLVIAAELLGAQEEGILFEIAVHVATLVAVLIFYRARILELLRGAVGRDGAAWSYIGKLGVATLPAVVAGLTARDFFESLFGSPWVAGVALLFTGCALWTTKRTWQGASAPEPSWLQAFLIGCAQVVAIVPGVSRSGTTVAAALALGVAPLAAAEFSFLMSVAAIAGAAVLMLPDATAASPEALRALAVGGAAALASGLAALWLFVRLLRSGGFHRFAWYAWAAGATFLAYLAVR
jgi:undecaprenyl-diphosphatase